MRGLFVTDVNKLDVLELPEPELGPYEALVEVLACGICNSTDWKIIEGKFQSGSFPILIGHESVGRVTRLGAEVRSFKEGDVVLRSALRDDQMPAPEGRSRWAGFVEKAVVTDFWAEKGAAYGAVLHRQQIVPRDVDPVQAVAMITLKENISCLKRTDVQVGHSLAIVGTGPVAQALVCVAALGGIAPIVVFGRQTQWEKMIVELGAHAYVAGDEYPAEVRSILAAGGFDRAIEAVGSRAALSRCLEVVKDDGRLNIYGVPPESEPYLEEQTSDPRTFRSEVLEAEAHEQLLDWMAQGRLNLADWVSDSIVWTDYARAFEMVKAKTANKAVLKFAD